MKFKIDLGYTVKLGDSYLHPDTLQYHLFNPEGDVIFDGNQFKPSPNLSSDKGIVSALMSFLTLQRGDTDKEHFDSYTDDQLKWTNSTDCSYLKLLVCTNQLTVEEI